MRTVRQRLAFSGLLFLALVALVYVGWVVQRSWSAYSWQIAGRGTVGGLYEADPELGFRLVPGAVGAERFPIGPDVPARVDREGFRVPVDGPDPSPRTRPLVLAFGCSFTFGAACTAEDAFAYRVAQGLGGSCVNAGVSSYGEAQMLILARRQIPRLRPDVVLFQHSRWLGDRSRTWKAMTYFGDVPTPTFVGTEARLRPPRFSPIVFDLPVDRYLRAEPGALGFLSFLFRAGFPMFLHDDAHRAWAAATSDAEEATPDSIFFPKVHAEVAELCRANGARLVYVVIGSGCPGEPTPKHITESGSLFVNASEALCGSLPGMEGLDMRAQCLIYLDHFAHWAGDPRVMIDVHPNAAAHAVIADQILSVLRADQGSR
ncbi:MAG: hypothetical protein ACKVXR_02495 [Planctomycetota bacterium]